jgi:hypothetical protein
MADQISSSKAHSVSNILEFRRAKAPRAGSLPYTAVQEQIERNIPVCDLNQYSLPARAHIMRRVLQRALSVLERAPARARSSDMHAYLTAFAEVSALDHVNRPMCADPEEIERTTLQAEASATRFLACLNAAPDVLRDAQHRFGSVMARRVSLLIRHHLEQGTATERRFVDDLLQHTLYWAQRYGSPARTRNLVPLHH